MEYSNYPLGITAVIACIMIFIILGITAEEALHFWGALICFVAKTVYLVSHDEHC